MSKTKADFAVAKGLERLMQQMMQHENNPIGVFIETPNVNVNVNDNVNVNVNVKKKPWDKPTTLSHRNSENLLFTFDSIFNRSASKTWRYTLLTV